MKVTLFEVHPISDWFRCASVHDNATRRFVASLETVLRLIKSKDSLSSSSTVPFRAKVEHKLPFRNETYTIRVHRAIQSLADSWLQRKNWPLEDQPHKLQEWFLHASCLELFPNSHSGRILDTEEIQTLLSAAAAALTHLRLPWILFLPVHDALRDAYEGICLKQNSYLKPKNISCIPCDLIRFEADSIHGRALPWDRTTPSSLLLLFAGRLRRHAPNAAAVCDSLASCILHSYETFDMDEKTFDDIHEMCRHIGVDVVLHATRRCYQLPLLSLVDDEISSLSGSSKDNEATEDHYDANQRKISDVASADSELELVVDTWDEDASWRPWAAEDDPIGGLELDALWTRCLPKDISQLAQEEARLNKMLNLDVHTSASHQETDASADFGNPSTADAWRITMVPRDYIPDSGHRGILVLQVVDQRRQFLHLEKIRAPADGARPSDLLLRRDSDMDAVFAQLSETSFSKMLAFFSENYKEFCGADSVDDLVSAGWWIEHNGFVPDAPSMESLQDVVRDLFQIPVLSGVTSEFQPRESLESTPLLHQHCPSTGCSKDSQHASLPFLGKTAPLESLTTRLSLHCVRFGSIRAVALLWRRFLREIRFSHWEKNVRLPRLHHNSGTWASNDPLPDAIGKAQSFQKSSRHEAHASIDTSTCLIHQHLQLLDASISTISRNGTKAAGQANGAYDDEDAAEHSSWASRVVTALSSPLLDDREASYEVLAAEGVLSQSDSLTLIDFPRTKVNIPVTQVPPPVTEVGVAEIASMVSSDHHHHVASSASSQTAHHAPRSESPTPPDVDGAWAQTHGALLFSDMQSFKAANPGCRFEDFIRWYSPRDWVASSESLERRPVDTDPQGSLSGDTVEDRVGLGSTEAEADASDGRGAYALSERMKSPDTAWRKLWVAAGAVPASRQPPLFRATSEGERALHFLDRLKPLVLFVEIFSLAFSGSMGLLSRSPAIRLPSVAAEMKSLSVTAKTLLEDIDDLIQQHMMPTSCPCSGPSPEVVGQQIYEKMRSLINGLCLVELTVVTAQSILQRFRWSVVDFEDVNRDGPLKEAIAEKMVASALDKHPGAIDLEPEEFKVLKALMSKVLRVGVKDDDDVGSNGCAWDIDPILSEWCVEMKAVKQYKSDNHSEHLDAMRGTDMDVKHRIFVRLLPAEMRVATIVGEEGILMH